MHFFFKKVLTFQRKEIKLFLFFAGITAATFLKACIDQSISL